MGARQSVAVATNYKSLIQQKITENCIVIFSKTTCPYCHRAKRLFDGLGVGYEAVELNQMDPSDGAEYQNVLREMTGAPSVPRVFVNGQFIGGGNETKALHENGQLLRLVQQCAHFNTSNPTSQT